MSKLDQKNVAKKKVTSGALFEKVRGMGIFIYFIMTAVWLEVIFHVRSFEVTGAELIHAVLFSACMAMIPAIICAFLPQKPAKVLAIIFTVFIIILFGVQTVYNEVFKNYLTLSLAGENAGQVIDYWREILVAIKDQWFSILLFMLPLIFLCTIGRKIINFGGIALKCKLIAAASTVALWIVLLATLRVYGTDTYSPYDLYNNEFEHIISMEKLGLLTTMRIDLGKMLFEEESDELVLEVIATTPTTVAPTTSALQPTTSDSSGTSYSTEQTTPKEEIEVILDYVLDTSPNILDIDFAKINETVTDKNVLTINNYFANATPTNKNEYTGMFEGYNLIKITAEAFCSYAVDEEITPTLYKLANTGFVFNNYYNQTWFGSTQSGEFVACMGLPVSNNEGGLFKKLGEKGNTLPFAMGNMLTSVGYSTYAYHNGSYNYYKRNLSHPIMGYIYKGVGNGLNIKNTWPQSDLEMIEVTMDDYIDKVPFHAYYMTISGHLNYSFGGNYMAKKNKAAVDHLEYSDECKAYLACNIELDKALEALINRLDEEGLLETTLIVLSSDHQPYGLSKEAVDEFAGHEVEETFELYKSTLIMWSGSMKEPVVVDKICSSLDIMPTICNLMGIEYDSRMYMGKDIFSDAEPLVVFGHNSINCFMTDKIAYNARNGKVTYLTEEEVDKAYINEKKALVKNMYKVAAAVINTDYYSYVEEYTPYGIDKLAYPEKYDFPIDY